MRRAAAGDFGRARLLRATPAKRVWLLKGQGRRAADDRASVEVSATIKAARPAFRPEPSPSSACVTPRAVLKGRNLGSPTRGPRRRPPVPRRPPAPFPPAHEPGFPVAGGGPRIRAAREVWIELGESRRRAPLIAPTPYPSPASVGGGRRRWRALPPPTLAGEAREIERSDDRTGGGWSGAGAGIPPHPTSANGSRPARRAFVSYRGRGKRLDPGRRIGAKRRDG